MDVKIIERMKNRLAKYTKDREEIFLEMQDIADDANDGETLLAARDELEEADRVIFAYRILIRYAEATDDATKNRILAALTEYLHDAPGVKYNLDLREDLQACDVI